jgi:hypothetical protein
MMIRLHFSFAAEIVLDKLPFLAELKPFFNICLNYYTKHHHYEGNNLLPFFQQTYKNKQFTSPQIGRLYLPESEMCNQHSLILDWDLNRYELLYIARIRTQDSFFWF